MPAARLRLHGMRGVLLMAMNHTEQNERYRCTVVGEKSAEEVGLVEPAEVGAA